jgi:hypothetical protein
MESAIDQAMFDEDGYVDDDVACRYAEELMDRFAASPEGAEATEECGDIGWAHTAIELGVRHLGVNIAGMRVGELEELLFEIVPRSVSTDPDDAFDIVLELRAFWRFVGREFNAPFASECLALLQAPTLAVDLRNEMADPANWGMAKSFFMAGMAAGYDMTTQEGLDAFQLAYNATVMERAAQQEVDRGVRGWFPDDPRPAERCTAPADARKARRRKRKAAKRSRRRNR